MRGTRNGFSFSYFIIFKLGTYMGRFSVWNLNWFCVLNCNEFVIKTINGLLGITQFRIVVYIEINENFKLEKFNLRGHHWQPPAWAASSCRTACWAGNRARLRPREDIGRPPNDLRPPTDGEVAKNSSEVDQFRQLPCSSLRLRLLWCRRLSGFRRWIWRFRVDQVNWMKQLDQNNLTKIKKKFFKHCTN